jgi:hypothetical protein
MRHSRQFLLGRDLLLKYAFFQFHHPGDTDFPQHPDIHGKQCTFENKGPEYDLILKIAGNP